MRLCQWSGARFCGGVLACLVYYEEAGGAKEKVVFGRFRRQQE
jgi:hypothetical protein